MHQNFIKSFAGLLSLALLTVGVNVAYAQQYCTPTYSITQCNNYNMYIDDFSTGGGVQNITNNNTGCGNTSTSYRHYSQLRHRGDLNSTVNFSVTIGASYPQGVAIWVDWNQDGDFKDKGEDVYKPTSTISAGGTRTGSFNIPLSANVGVTRMRVRSSYSTTSIPDCGAANYGECEDYDFEVISNCPTVPTVNITNFNSQSVAFNWAPANNSVGYEYAVTTSANGPNKAQGSTPNQTATVTGLAPSTNYFVHVRNECSKYPSSWTTVPFTTLPPCSDPTDVKVAYIDSSKFDFVWKPIGTALEYEYFVNLDKSTPTSSSGATVTNSAFGSAVDLQQGTVYYVHIRALCSGNDSSAWSLDSIYVPIACRTPTVMFKDITTDRAIAYWDAQNTAVEYEQALTETATLPPAGLNLSTTSKLLPFLDAKATYYFHIRSHCEDHGIVTASEWKNYAVQTYGVNVPTVSMSDEILVVYPNPATSELVLNIGGQQSGSATAVVTDMLGKVLKTHSFTGYQTRIDVATLPAGMYILKYSDGQRSQQIKFNKQ